MSHPEVRFGILGPLQVHRRGAAVELNAAKPRVLLATLLLDANRTVTMDAIVEALWPQRPPRSAVANVRTYASALRAALGDADRVRAGTAGYTIRVGPGELDLHVVDDLADRARAARRVGDHTRALDLLHQAAGHWRGRTLEDLARGPVWEGELGRIEERRVAVAEERAALELALGRHAAAIGPLRDLLADHPFRERLWLQLVLALYGAGRRAEALGAYGRVRRLLAEELGVEPCAELRQVHEAVLRGDPVATTVTDALAAVLPHAVPAVCQLPRDLPDFQGREAEVAEVLRLVGDGRGAAPAVVISGPPGVGKSALATRVGRLLRPRFPDGQLHLALGGTTSGPEPPRELLADVLRALGVVGRALPATLSGRIALYRARLAGRRMLLVLDDAADADQVRPLLPPAEGSAVLVTSRRRLADLLGARPVELGMLDVRAGRALLVSACRPAGVALDPATAERISAACGGLPLALRLAAGRLTGRRAWPPQVLAERLADESRRLGVLGVPPGSAVDADALPGPAAAAFRALGVLGPAPAMPTWVIGALTGRPDAEDVVDALVDAHVIDPVGVDAVGQPRFALHDLVRLCAREAARGGAAERRRTAERVSGGWLALTDLAAAALPVSPFVPRVDGAARWPVDPRARERAAAHPRAWFDAERRALVAAVDQAAGAGLADHAWELAVSLVPYFDMRAHYDDWDRTHRAALAAVRAAGQRRGEAALLRGLGQVRAYEGDHEQATVLFARSRRLFADAGDERGATIATTGLATVARMRGRYDEALELARRALAGSAAAGDAHGEALARAAVGRIHRARGDRDAALHWLTGALEVSRAAGDAHREAHVLYEIGLLRAAEGDRAAALTRFRAALGIFRRIGDTEGVADAIAVIGRVSLAG
ncbi:AfsR/SARP family transcriptional regulator [Nocardiopsis trehalosi]|uniref:AfsR/SARP family transcriptional regulator n=1 Tax=Nocardiopsis trehalosi TaxID=109329 RepID=UPI000A007348|nr:BTAD domain-containing putative transcriptional regulator [Nocardiopsis trehalosi]